jgi:hypothetical protein
MRTSLPFLFAPASLAVACVAYPVEVPRAGPSPMAAAHSDPSPASNVRPSAPSTQTAPTAPIDPSKNEIDLPASSGWNASLVLDQGSVGIWTVGTLKAFPQFGTPEIAALDDLGRFHVLWSYSGKWTDVATVNDGKWLGGLVQADLDPRVPGKEIYVGSQNGNVWEVVSHLETFLDCRLIAQIPGREIHTLVGGELDLHSAGAELFAFTRPGGLYVLRPRAALDGFEATLIEDLPGRIRDALTLPAQPGAAPEIATVGRHGRLETVRIDGGQTQWTTIHEEAMGIGRLALKPGSTPDDTVLYSVADDGRVWRHERATDRAWKTELIYVGPQGMRGCAAGRFDADAKVETVAVFGYSQRVELLSKRSDGWHVETLFEDRDKGHWLCTGEFDGRNATDELVTSGYAGRIVLLSRPPGYGLAGVLATTQDH